MSNQNQGITKDQPNRLEPSLSQRKKISNHQQPKFYLPSSSSSHHNSSCEISSPDKVIPDEKKDVSSPRSRNMDSPSKLSRTMLFLCFKIWFSSSNCRIVSLSTVFSDFSSSKPSSALLEEDNSNGRAIFRGTTRLKRLELLWRIDKGLTDSGLSGLQAWHTKEYCCRRSSVANIIEFRLLDIVILNVFQ